MSLEFTVILTIKGIRDVLEISWVNGWGEGLGTQANVWVEEVVKSHHCRVEILEEEVQESGDLVTMKYSLIYLMAGRITDRWHQVAYTETHWCVCSGVTLPTRLLTAIDGIKQRYEARPFPGRSNSYDWKLESPSLALLKLPFNCITKTSTQPLLLPSLLQRN